MIKFEQINEKKGRIITTGAGSLANGLRRVLLDEIKTFCFDTSSATLETNDSYLTFDLLRSLTFVRFLNPFESPVSSNKKKDNRFEEKIVIENKSDESSFSQSEKEKSNSVEFYIKIRNIGIEPIAILSSHICDDKGNPIDFVEVWELGTLSPGCKLAITGIKITSGIGREHAKFSAVFGPVTYRPTDVCFVYYLNEKGKIEDNMRAVPLSSFSQNEKEKSKSEELTTNLLIWNEEWGKKMSKEDRLLAESLEKISYTGQFNFSEISDSNDFEITFNAHLPERTFKEACAVIARDIQGDPESLTITAGEVLRWFCFQEMECPIYGNFNQDNYKIKVLHVDEKKIMHNAISKIMNILKPHL